MIEIWKDIECYEGVYQVSNFGRVKSLKREIPYRNETRTRNEKILNPHVMRGGYLQISIGKKRSQKSLLVHRLVANAFIPNPDNKEQVNHIDGNKQNNCVENLEWCTRKENMLHSLDIGLRSDAKKVEMYNEKGEFVKSFKSIHEASRETNAFPQNISRCCQGKIKSAGGWHWKYGEVS